MYGKIFASMYDGSLRTRCPWQALVTFQQMLVLADKEGELDMTAEAMSFRTGIPLDILTLGVEALEQPDPDSRSPAEEGRRITRLDPNRSWGWRIVNYEHYRLIRSHEERREYHRLYGQTRRDNKKTTRINSNQHESTESTKAVSSKQYVDTEVKTNDQTTDGLSICCLLAAAANRGIMERFPAHTRPIIAGHGSSTQTAEAFAEAGVEVEFAVAKLYELGRSLTTKSPPEYLRYFQRQVIDAWAKQNAHEQARAFTPPADVLGGVTWADVRAQIEAEAA